MSRMVSPSPDHVTSSGKESDITIYGATSFVARYVCEYLFDVVKAEHEKAGSSTGSQSLPLRVTLAGRNRSKLESLLEQWKVPTSYSAFLTVDVFVAEASDRDALDRLARRTRVVLACAGPFGKYGSQVVGACADAGTDYVDITGEVDWAAEMRRRHHARAVETGARLVNFAGFDSVPSDLSVWAAVRALRDERREGVAVSRATTWHEAKGLANGGTLHTALGMRPNLRACLRDTDTHKLRRVPFFMQHPFELIVSSSEGDNEKSPLLSPEWIDEAARAEWWNNLPSVDNDDETFLGHNIVSVPFFMAVCNAKIVQASAAALGYNTSSPPGRYFTYRERFLQAGFDRTRNMGLLSAVPSLLSLVVLYSVMAIFLIPFLGPRLALFILPPGSGPPERLIRNGHGAVHAVVEDETTDARASCHLTFAGDPGNLITAQCVVECALCLAWQRRDLPKQTGGFGTPAETLGGVLLERLRQSPVRPVQMEVKVWGGGGSDSKSTKKDD